MLIDELKDFFAAIIREEIERATAERSNGQQKLLLNTKEAATLLSLPVSKLATMARRGEIPCIQLGHYIRFRVEDLHAFIEKSCTQNCGVASPATAKRRSRKSSASEPVVGCVARSANGAGE